MSKLSHSPGPCRCGSPDSQPAHTCPLTETDHPENVDPLCTCCADCVERCLARDQDARSALHLKYNPGLHVATLNGCSCGDPRCPTAEETLRHLKDHERDRSCF